ncbi:MAG: hypothetical protein OEZ36_04420 [Spirochaetota bacterium]|nr:hypothetical protein [Spirochaetota bacterium]
MLAKVLMRAGSVMMLGFGLWHFFVPSIHNWFSYIPEAPSELLKAIRAANFFLSLELCVFGVMGITLSLMITTNRKAVLLYLLLMSGLWIIRAFYQLVEPQGGALALWIQVLLNGSFLLTALLFIVPLLLLIRTPDATKAR